MAIARGEPGNRYQEGAHPDLYKVTALRSFSEAFSFSVARTAPSVRLVLNDALDQVTEHQRVNYESWTHDHAVFARLAEFSHARFLSP